MRMKTLHDPEGIILIRRAYIWVRKAGFPACRQADKLAAVETVQRVDHEYIFKIIMAGQFDLIDEIGARLRFTIRAVDEILPCSILLDQHKIAMTAYVFEELKDTFSRKLWRRGKEAVRSTARIENRILWGGWDGFFTRCKCLHDKNTNQDVQWSH